jgi:hypothetical protein
MYQVDGISALRNAVRASRSGAATAVDRNVIALGFTSLLTDISSEMVATVLPVYLVLHLGLTPLRFGVVDGLYNGATAVLLLLGGVVADRARRYKEVAAVGYGVSAVCKLGLIAAGSAWSLIVAAVAIDRAAKGLRTAPRDALISLSASRANLAASFGVHRAFDSGGAMLGPLAALALLTALPNAFDVVFMASFSIGLVGLGVLLLFVENRNGHVDAAVSAQASISALRTLAGGSGFRLLMLSALALSLVTISDGFLYLAIQQRVGFRAALLPLLYVGTATSYLLLAIPAGRLADRIGRRWTFLLGYAGLAVAYVAALGHTAGTLAVGVCVVSLGAYYAMTDGVLMALASSMLPQDIRGTGLACVTTVTSTGRFASSLAFGALWTMYGVTTSLLAFLAALVVIAVVAGVVFARGVDERPGR